MIHTTGIGSLPFTSFPQALTYVAQNYSLPFLPETEDVRTRLPRMISHLCSANALAAMEQSNWSAFKSTLTTDNLQFSYVYDLSLWQGATTGRLRKLQMIGPFTLSYLWQKQFPQASIPEIRALTVIFLAEKWAHLRQVLDQTPTLLYFDEPALRVGDLQLTADLLKEIGAESRSDAPFIPGIHTCAKLPLAPLSGAFSNFGLAIDLSQSDNIEADAKILQRHLATNRQWVIGGIVDTGQNHCDKERAKILCRGMQNHLKPLGTQQTALSGACGTATRSLAFEQDLAHCLQDSAKYWSNTADT